jgi:hypothetical protein
MTNLATMFKYILVILQSGQHEKKVQKKGGISAKKTGHDPEFVRVYREIRGKEPRDSSRKHARNSGITVSQHEAEVHEPATADGPL